MFKNIIPRRKRPTSPVKETSKKLVPTSRFNEMIEYYTCELKSRLVEIDSLKKENEMLIKTAIKSSARSDELNLHTKKLQEEIRVLRQKN
ncbi:hypothetical protein HQ545_03200 [Candidatus Woesearchaeota archaeon]|nr:hypothetical protein [Candidatus Woesearchaeota archaeon]